jgi:hypothetical protein
MPTPLSSPTIRLYPQCGFSVARRRIDSRSERSSCGRPGPPTRVRPPAGDQLAVPAKQRLRLERGDCPRGPGQRAAQRCQQHAISPRQLRRRCLSTEDRQLVAEDEDLQLLRATRPPQQPDQREQVPDDEIHKRPEQATLPRPQYEHSNLASPATPESDAPVCEPHGCACRPCRSSLLMAPSAGGTAAGSLVRARARSPADVVGIEVSARAGRFSVLRLQPVSQSAGQFCAREARLGRL